MLKITAENIFYILNIRENNTGDFMHQEWNPGFVEICGDSGSVTTLYAMWSGLCHRLLCRFSQVIIKAIAVS